MRDRDIRQALRQSLHEAYGNEPNTAIIDELSIRGGSTRIDLALVNGVLHGFEVKSDYDTLLRLPAQVESYCTVCDCVTLVVGEKLVKKAVELVPDWWGITLLRSSKRGLEFRDLKCSQTNPSLNPIAVAQLLHWSEAHTFASELGLDKPFKRTRGELCELLASEIALPMLSDRVRCCIRKRQSDATRRSYDD